MHRAQVATDPKARVIVAVHAEPASGHEADSLPVIIARARWLRHKVSEIVADAGYASAAAYRDLDERGITAYNPPQPNMRHTEHGHAARARCKSPVGVGAAIDRITHGEALSQSSNATAPDAPGAVGPRSYRSSCCSRPPRSTSSD